MRRITWIAAALLLTACQNLPQGKTLTLGDVQLSPWTFAPINCRLCEYESERQYEGRGYSTRATGKVSGSVKVIAAQNSSGGIIAPGIKLSAESHQNELFGFTITNSYNRVKVRVDQGPARPQQSLDEGQYMAVESEGSKWLLYIVSAKSWEADNGRREVLIDWALVRE